MWISSGAQELARPTQEQRSATQTAITSSSGSGSGEQIRKRQPGDLLFCRRELDQRREGAGSGLPVYAGVREIETGPRPRSSTGSYLHLQTSRG
jgi:hypothetical protein